MKQSAVEWYEIEINSLIEKYEAKEISKRDFITMKHNLFYDAKEMEKQQQGYIEKEVLAFGKDCFYKGFEKAQKDDANCYTAFREEIGILVKQFKKK
jgi:CHASE3 domain sensor protein